MRRDRLDEANIQLGKELWAIKSSLAIYSLIGLHAKAINSGRAFLAFVQNQSLAAVALELAKVFEREDAHELCSVSGVYRLAKHEQIQDLAAARAFVGKYGITASEDWTRDVDQVFSAQRPWIRSHMQVIDRVRNTRLVHMQQDAPMSSLPSIAAFEELLAFAFELHAFVVEHATGGMKRYNILVHSFSHHKENFADDVIGICAGLWNLVLSY